MNALSATDICRNCGGKRHQHRFAPVRPTCSHCPQVRGEPAVCLFAGPESGVLG